MFYAAFTQRTPKWRKLNLKYEFCNWTNVVTEFRLAYDVKNRPIFIIFDTRHPQEM